MQIDITQFLGNATRRITSQTYEGQDVRVLTIKRVYPTSRDDLWDALTNPARIPNWFLPISGNLELGGRYQFEGNAGGEILECDPVNRFRVTWEFGGQVSWVVITLAPLDDETKLTLEHSACVPDEMWKEYGPGAVGIGWEFGLYGLAKHLMTGGMVAGADGMAWMMSDEGKSYTRQTSQYWADASIAFGTPSDEANAAAERTTKAYTGEA